MGRSDSPKATDHTPASESAVRHVHYPDADRELEEVLAGTVETDSSAMGDTPTERDLVLSRGDEWHFPDDRVGDPFAYAESDTQDIRTTIVRDEPVAIGYYLHLAEINALDEEEILGYLRESAPEWVAMYESWVADLSPRDRRLRLLDLLEWRVDEGDDWAAGIYLNERPCTWRSTNLSEAGTDAAAELANAIDVRPSMCYWTAQKAALHAFDDSELADRVEYVEGIALPTAASQAIRHAWIEVDGEVAELSWPWHQYDGADAVYFGVSVDPETVREARHGRDLGGPVFVDEADLPTLG
ncbi:hypothetical protein ACFQDD_00450 [Halorubrum pallidum]|uniref:Uncharacterized protein n=1 Tax=Halorubrum pallidum TaxID=1526114 RepID=A0ABD5T387_9EURY